MGPQAVQCFLLESADGMWRTISTIKGSVFSGIIIYCTGGMGKAIVARYILD